MAKVLVAGSSGLLGQALSEEFKSAYDVKGVSKSGRLGGERCDLADEKSVTRLLDAWHPDLVVNAAAYSDVDGCEHNPQEAHRSNGWAVKVLAEGCRTRKVPFIHVSTDYVFDGSKRRLYEPADPVFPVNIYGLTKLEGEFYARQYAYQTCVVRTSWLFGPGSEKNFVNVLLKRLKSEPVVSVLSDQTDSPTHAADLARAVRKMAAYLTALDGSRPFFELFQFCNKGAATRLEMARAVKDILKLKGVQVLETDASKIAGRSAVRPAYACMSTRRYEEFFNDPIRSWQDALAEYVRSAAA